VTLLEKYRTFLIIGTAEGLGLILTKPKDISLFFLTWTLLTFIMLAYSFLDWRFGKPKTFNLGSTETTPEAPLTRDIHDLNTQKNRNYSLILMVNLIVYVVLTLFF
jgi:hypothetical protein